MVSGSEGPWYYEQTELGFNYRLTDIAAALGLSQLGSLGRFLERREELAERYDTLLEDLPVIRPTRAPGRRSSWHLYVVQLDDRHTDVGRRAVFEAMRSRGIGVNVHYIPVHLQPYYRALGFSRGYCPEAERYYARALSLPIFPGLSDADQDVVVRALGEALQ